MTILFILVSSIVVSSSNLEISWHWFHLIKLLRNHHVSLCHWQQLTLEKLQFGIILLWEETSVGVPYFFWRCRILDVLQHILFNHGFQGRHCFTGFNLPLINLHSFLRLVVCLNCRCLFWHHACWPCAVILIVKRFDPSNKLKISHIFCCKNKLLLSALSDVFCWN